MGPDDAAWRLAADKTSTGPVITCRAARAQNTPLWESLAKVAACQLEICPPRRSPGSTIKSEEMNEEGKLVSEKACRNQAPVGTWKYHWPDGKTVKIKEEYENGLLNGTRLVYYQQGEKQVDETYQFGMVTGLVKNS